MNIGLVTNNLGLNDRSLNVIVCLNKMAENNYNPVAFVRNIEPYPISPLFCILKQSEVFSFNGTLIAMDIESARLVLANVSSKRKIYYLWDLEWVFTSQENYNNNADVYLSPHLNFVARSTDHAKIFRKVWGKRANVIEEFEYEQIRKLTNNN
jgi:hypothetical protein